MSIKKHEVLVKASQREFNPQETMQWLTANKIWLATWGFRAPTNYENKALFFRVSGFHHNGYVIITLAWDDTYTVTLVSTQWNVKKVITDVYCDVLAETIDIEVERIPEYNV